MQDFYSMTSIGESVPARQCYSQYSYHVNFERNTPINNSAQTQKKDASGMNTQPASFFVV